MESQKCMLNCRIRYFCDDENSMLQIRYFGGQKFVACVWWRRGKCQNKTVKRIPLRWITSSPVYVLSWESSPLALKNNHAATVGYHTPCMSAERELDVKGIFPQYLRATTNPVFSGRQGHKTDQIRQSKWRYTCTHALTENVLSVQSLIFCKGQESAVVCLTLSCSGIK